MVCERKACCSVICWLHPWGSGIATPDYLQASASASEVILQREIETFFSHFYLLSISYFLYLLSGPLYLFAFISKPPFVSGVLCPPCFQRCVWGSWGFDDHHSEDFLHHLNISKVFSVCVCALNKPNKTEKVQTLGVCLCEAPRDNSSLNGAI